MEETRVPGVNTVKWIEPMAIQIGTTMKNLRRSGLLKNRHIFPSTKKKYTISQNEQQHEH
jgi:hypothetical protein